MNKEFFLNHCWMKCWNMGKGVSDDNSSDQSRAFVAGVKTGVKLARKLQ